MGYPSAMVFSPQDLHDLDIAEEVRIETQGAGGTVHSTIVWVVVDGGEAFVRSVRGTAGRWYREALANPIVTLDDSGRRIEAIAAQAPDTTSVERVSRALARKYAADPALPEMLRPDVLGTTLILQPHRPV